MMHILTFNRTLQVLFPSAKVMDMNSRTPLGIWIVLFLMLVTPFTALSPSSFDVGEPTETLTSDNAQDLVNARAQTTWSGTVSVSSTYTISIFDELITSCTC